MSDEYEIGQESPESGTLTDCPGPENAGEGMSEREVQAAEGVGNRRRNGHVARLPKVVRDRINQMLDDGVEYEEIIGSLGEEGKGLTKPNLTRWKQGGYQDWLLEQRWVEQLRAQQEVSTDLVRDNDPADLNQAALQLGTFQIFRALRDLEAGGMAKRLGGDPAAFARLLNALARASRESLMLQKYRAAAAEARAQLKEMKDPHRKLTDDERRAIIAKVDEVLGINLDIPRRPEREPEIDHETIPGEDHTTIRPCDHTTGEGMGESGAGETESADPGAEPAAAASAEPNSGETAEPALGEGQLTPEQEADLIAKLAF